MKWVITDKAQIQHNITWKVLVGPDLCKEFQGRVDVFYARLCKELSHKWTPMFIMNILVVIFKWLTELKVLMFYENRN